VKARLLGPADREDAARFLAADAQSNLFLLDLVQGLGQPPTPGEVGAELWGAWRRRTLVGVAALRPCIVLASQLPPAVLEVLTAVLAGVESGLIKSSIESVEMLWRRLEARGRRALVDRVERAYVLRPNDARLVGPPQGARVRQTSLPDLGALVEAARASLREEQRPDPFDGDPEGFRRWVRGRLPRALVTEQAGSIVFVGYADVRRKEGWLLQGVYTWPAARRRGFALAGVSSLCRAAFDAGAEHVQLSVVEGNAAGGRLYAKLGFQPFASLRTILFSPSG
jgi:ribosomal protein S18 acetylase RimI-like enzyme